MDDTQKGLLSIFRPYYLKKVAAVAENKLKFVQYTSAESAMEIIRNREIWLRNARAMNDFMEVEHGLDCLITSFKSDESGKAFQSTLETLFPGLISELVPLFDSWIPHFKVSTYMTCVSEHPNDENIYGRLSMWRAYGGRQSVAIVLNPAPLLQESDAFNAYANPVYYLDNEGFEEEFRELNKRLSDNSAFIKIQGREVVKNYLFDTFQNFALSIKHPGFKEEREWRVTYNPIIAKSPRVRSAIVAINGVPQEIQKIQLKDIPEDGFYGISIPDFVERIIIGPNEHQLLLKKTFISLLAEAGCQDPESKVVLSGIPLR